MTYITFEGEGEVLITNECDERLFRKEYFGKKTGRNIDLYDRGETEGRGILIRSEMKLEDY